MNVIEFSKALVEKLPDFEMMEGSNYILKHKRMGIIIYPQTTISATWSKPSKNVNAQSLSNKIKRILFRITDVELLEEFRSAVPVEINRRYDSNLIGNWTPESLTEEVLNTYIYPRIRSLESSYGAYADWISKKKLKEEELENSFKKTQEAIAMRQKERMERYKNRNAIFAKLKAHLDYMGANIESVREGEYINLTLKNGAKAKVVATDNGAYLSEVTVSEDFKQDSMANLFKRLDNLANL